MSDEIKPALAAAEWRSMLHATADVAYFADTEDLDSHAKAALHLYGQPFGFTHADVALLRDIERQIGPASDVRNLADRIAALLPPEP